LSERSTSIAQDIAKLKARSLDELQSLMEFRALTQFAYMMLYTEPQRLSRAKLVVGYGHFGPEAQLPDKVIRGPELPGILQSYEKEYLHELVTLQLVSLFEHFVFDVLRALFLDDPRRLSSSRQVDVGTIVTASTRDVLLEQLAERELNELKYKNVDAWFERLRSLVSVAGPSADIVGALAELKATRDILVHNRAVINDIYLRKAGPRARGTLGDRIIVSGEYFRDSWHLVAGAIAKTGRQLCEKLSV
jgi:hypothetical protein